MNLFNCYYVFIVCIIIRTQLLHVCPRIFTTPIFTPYSNNTIMKHDISYYEMTILFMTDTEAIGSQECPWTTGRMVRIQ